MLPRRFTAWAISAAPNKLTFQVPCETATANSVPITVNVGGGSATVSMPVQAAAPGIFQTVMSDGTRARSGVPSRRHIRQPAKSGAPR